jgi:hypothetical protein
MQRFPLFLPGLAAFLLLALPACQQMEQAARDAVQDAAQAAGEPAPAQDIDATAEGEIGLVEAPVSVVPNTSLESDERLYVFREQAEQEVSPSLVVNARGAGTYGSPGDLAEAQLPAGARVQSYFLHFDVVGGTGGSVVHKQGRVTFAEPIVAVITKSRHIDASDEALGAGGVTYPEPGIDVRGLELNQADQFTIGADRRTLQIDFGTFSSSDQMRILTEAP